MKTLLPLAACLALGLLLVGNAPLHSETGRIAEKVDRIAELVDGVNESIAVWGGVEYLAEPAVDHLIDRLNESGYAPVPLDPDDPLLKRRVVFVSAGMNERTANFVVERLVYLDALDPTAPIDLRLTTSGGWLDSAFAIVDTMRSIRAPVNVTALGGCYSAGTVVLAAATGERTALPNTVLSVHVNDYQPTEEGLDLDAQDLARFRRVYRQYTEVPDDWFTEPGDNQYYFNAKEALEMKLIDKITEPHWKTPAVAGKRRSAA